ncbi:fructose-1,6-bisphosphatase [Candidatus Peregrinibacteria bacterium]|nr:fructose-1,6-bisphosphatase [Candidatus Peregrinibacteria bacterium]
MPSPSCPRPERLSLSEHLRAGGVPDDLRHLLLAIAQSAKYIQYALRTTGADLAGTRNPFGEEQLKLDILSDTIIRQHLCETRLVSACASEERPALMKMDSHAKFMVVYDPLDGSSLVDANFAIGSIFGVYPASETPPRMPREQVAALYVLYGPRTVLVYSTGKSVHEFLLNEVGEFVLLREHIRLGEIAKNYSPGNLRAVTENTDYRRLVDHWLAEELTLRYSGCMVADIHHMLSKGQGVFTNVGGGSYPEGKLRLLFECGPFAYILEHAGGKASNGQEDILDVPIRSFDQRTPVILGSAEEVRRAQRVLNPRKAP